MKRSSLKIYLFFLAVIFTIPLIFQPPAALAIEYRYTMIDFPGANSTYAYGINDSGTIVGSYRDGTGEHAFLYERGSYTTINFPGEYRMIYATGINNSGDIVGNYVPADNSTSARGFLYAGGNFTTLNLPGYNGEGHTDMIPGFFYSWAYGINDRGQVVGYSGDDWWDVADHGFLYEAGNFTTIGPGNYPLGYMEFHSQSAAYGINNSGSIVGFYSDYSPPQGFLYERGSYTTINFPGSSSTGLQGINDSGDIVGWYHYATPVVHNFLYERGRYTTIDLPGTGYAQGINNSGEIVGWYSDGATEHGFLLTPVPEPSTLLLIGAGLWGFVFLRKRGKP